MTNQANDKTEIQIKSLIIKSILSVIFFTIVVIVLSSFFKESLVDFSRRFVNQYGILALFFSFFITAISPFPLPDHAASAFALIGGMNFWINVGVSTLGSVLGAVIAYFLGRILKKTNLFKIIMRKYEIQTSKLVHKYGIKSLVIVALTPLPDSPLSWMSGTLDISFKKIYFCLLHL